jgi:ATP/maltotriose-dependent transcriptional regulator MalT
MERSRPGLASSGLSRLGDLRARQGRREEARELYERAGQRGLVGLGALALDGGDAEGAAQMAERVLRRMPDGAMLDRLPALELLARARIALGDLDAAAGPCAAVRDAAGAFGTPFVAGHAHLLDAALAAARGDHQAARRAAEDAIDCFEDAAAPYDAALARIQLAVALQAVGSDDGAKREAAGARRVLQALGARNELERLEAASLLDGHGALGDLTPRELEVLRLVSRGLNDGEIAGELVVSPHTVHRHVANVRVKLGLPSRAAAVAYAAKAGLL